MLRCNRKHLSWIAVAVLTVVIVGCGSSGPRQTRRMQELGIEGLSA